MSIRSTSSLALGLSLLVLLPASPAWAELAVSQLVVELKPSTSRTADIEIYNDSEERAFVSVEPREIVAVGLQEEMARKSPDPEQLGLLVSPRRLVIEPHQRRRLRIAALGRLLARERVYRVTVKPVSGDVTSGESGLKLLVGYDLLVLVRPAVTSPKLDVARAGKTLTITNRGNASVEVAEGKQCDDAGNDCRALPGKRLYAGASWQQILPMSAAGEYRVRSTAGWSTIKF